MGILTPSIAGSAVNVYEGSLQIDDSISAVSTLMCKIRDDAGTSHYTKGQPITLSDSLAGLLYSGFISTATEDRESPNPLIKTDIGARDNHYLAEKRTYDGPEFTNMPAGAIFCQLLNTLSQEGITAKYAARRDTTATDFNAGTLTSVVGTSNVGDGDLELSLAGSTVTTTENTTSQFNSGTLTNMQGLNNALQLTPLSGIRLYGQGIQSGGNNFLYQQIWTGSYTIASGDSLQYDVWINADSPDIMAGIDGVCTDGTSVRDYTDSGGYLLDQNGLRPHPATDLSGFANGQWYSRTIDISRISAKVFSSFRVAFESDKNGYFTAYFKNVRIMNGATTKLTVFSTSATALQTSGVISNSNYINPSISVTTVYSSSGSRVAASNSLTSVGNAKTSFLSWNAVAPTGTEVHVDTSMDGGATWVENQNHATILTILAGMKLASVSLYTRVRMLITGKEPIITPTMSSLVSTVYPSWAYSKTEVQAIYGTQTQLNTGTITNTKTNSPGSVTLNGFWRNWNTGDLSSQTVWGTGTPAQFVSGGRLGMNCTNASSEVRSQLVFAGNWQNFTLDVDMQVDTFGAGSIVYRTTNWNNANDTFAWHLDLSTTQISLDYGSNSGSTGSFTQVSVTNFATALSVGMHHVQLIINGTSHQAFVDGVRYVNVTNSTYNQSGGIGLRSYNATSGTHTTWFDNFGVVAALSGTWQSPAIAISGATTAGYNGVYFNTDLTGNADCSCLLQISYDLSTWYTVNNGDPLPTITLGQSLSGKNAYIRATLTAADASGTPTLIAASLIQTQQMNASGTRVSPALSLSTVGRLGGSVVAWNSILLSGCTLGVDVQIDSGTWVDVTSSNGGAIPGLNAQPNPTNDSFSSNTSANYTSTFATGGAAVTSATFDTTNSRLLLTGGTNALYISNAPTGVGDMEMFVDMDESDVGGMVFHYIDGNNFYDVVIRDGSSPASTNTITLFRTLTGTRTQVAQATNINFVRGTYHRFKVNMTGSVITVYMDGIQMLTYTDATPVGAGKCGMRNDTAAKISRYYQINIQPQGDDVSAHTVQTRLRLASTNPLASPQVPDLMVAVFGTTIQAGAIIPQTDFFHKYMDKNIDSLAKASNFWYYFDKNRVAYFLSTNGVPAPWVASDGGSPVTGIAQGDFMDANITVEDASDLYRNRQIIDNVLASVTINETRIGDGAATSWTFGNEWAGAPTITVNGVVATVGVKNVDTGKQFYYAVGDKTITEDSSGPTYDASFSITFNGPGQYLTYSQADNTTEQAARAAVEGVGTGIVTNVEDGTGLTKAQGDALAQDRLNQYSVRGRLLKATTRRSGLAPGQLLNVFLPAHNIWDGLFLIRQISTRFTTEGPTGSMVQQGWYTIEAISGADVGDWTKMYQRAA